MNLHEQLSVADQRRKAKHAEQPETVHLRRRPETRSWPKIFPFRHYDRVIAYIDRARRRCTLMFRR